jgi:hypothetical protein
VLSTFVVKFNLRRYTKDALRWRLAFAEDDEASVTFVPLAVGRCRLTVSKSVLQAPMVSALETEM